MYTLWSLSPNSQAIISNFSTSMPSDYLRRLQEIGLHKGRMILCLQHIPFGGPRIYQIAESVFSLESELANNIFIEETLS